uniref:Putative amino acid transporter, transmembrane domain-containing protein n=1 Tax=Helianthus annuus TaxID=4232 RepID=A0A251S788_HELAN
MGYNSIHVMANGRDARNGTGKRLTGTTSSGSTRLGKNSVSYIVVPQQLIVEVSVNIVYMVTGGKSLQKFHDLVCGHNCKDIKLTYFIMIFASVHFVLSHLPNF